MPIWFPYYFAESGFITEAPYLSSIHCFFFPIGVYLFDFFFSRPHSSPLRISYTMQIINTLCHLGLCFVPFYADRPLTYAICFVLTGVSYGGPFGYHTQMEMKARGRSPRELYLMLSFSRFLYQLFAFVELVAVGYLMEKGNCP